MKNKYADSDIVVVEALRTIVGKSNGTIKDLTCADLGTAVMSELMTKVEQKSGTFKRTDLNHMVLGLCIGAGIGQNLPRQIALRSNVDVIETAFTVNEMCGSGLEAIIQGTEVVKNGEYKTSLVGGVESPPMSPYFITTDQLQNWAEDKVESIQTKVVKADVHDALWCKMYDVHTIVHAENTTAEYVKHNNLNPDDFKKEIDEYTVMSHDRAYKAKNAGVLKNEIVVIPGTSPDDELQPPKKIDTLLKRKGTQFTPNGIFLSNQNSPPLASCASMLLIMTYQEAKRLHLKPLVRINGHARSGITPKNFLLAPIEAVNKLLSKTKTTLAEYDLMEVNTAFGSQMIFNQRELKLDMNKVNIYGDCLAFGHPIGAAGARLSTTLIHALERENKDLGMVAICLGGGNAIAISYERCNE